MTSTKLYIFTQNGDTSSSDFLNDPFLPINIASASDQYAGIQLLTILSIDADTCPFYSPVHKEQLFNAANAAQSQVENSLTFVIPTDHPGAQHVVEGNLVAFKDLDGNFQLFEMITPVDFHDALLYRQVVAINAGQSELADDWISHLAVTNQDAAPTLGQVLNGTRWQVGQVDDLGTGSITIDRASVLTGLQGLLSVWGGEFRFRVTIEGSRITGMYVDWLSRRGQNTGKRFVYGKDLTSMQRTVDLTNLKTALRGYGKQDSAGNYLTFANITWSTANGDPVDKPPGQDWVGDPVALSQWGRAGGTRNRFGEYADTSQTDPATLLLSTWDALQAIKTPLLSYQMSVADLEEIAGLSHEAVRMGDTVATIDTLVNPVLREQARIVEIDRNLIDPLQTQVVLGNFLPSTVNTDTQVSNLQSQVNSIQGGSLQVGDPIDGSQLQGTIDLLKAALQNNQAFVYTTVEDGIIVLDKPMDQSPTKAVKLGGGIFGIANSKNPDGTWSWKTFGDGDGFVADLIIAGTLVGVAIMLGGKNNGNGQFTLYDNNGNVIITMDNTGIKLSNGATILGGSGVLSTLVFQSSGPDQGWQEAGWWSTNNGTNLKAYMSAYIPPNFVVTSATLYTKSMPVTENYDTPPGWWQITQARLSYSTDVMNAYMTDYTGNLFTIVEAGAVTDITSAAWGGYWSPDPTTHTVQMKTADVAKYLTSGQRITFIVDSNAPNPGTSSLWGGEIQFELVVTGYKNG